MVENITKGTGTNRNIFLMFNIENYHIKYDIDSWLPSVKTVVIKHDCFWLF